MTTPYQEGFRARQRGEPMTENPYPEYTDVHGLWNDGWRDQPAAEVKEPRTAAGSLD